MFKNKKVLGGLAAFVVLAVIVFGFAGSSLDRIVKKAIESYGTAATQTTVSLGGVNISLKNGEGTLKGLSIDNPAGFSGNKAIALGAVSVKIDTDSLTGTGPLVINEMHIANPRLSYEMTAASISSNLDAIVHNAKSYAGSDMTPKRADTSATGRKIAIRKLTIADGEVAISSPLLMGKDLAATLPNIILRDIGRKTGATPADIAQVLISTLGTSAIRAATAAATQSIDSLKTLGRDATKATGQAGSTVRGLLNR